MKKLPGTRSKKTEKAYAEILKILRGPTTAILTPGEQPERLYLQILRGSSPAAARPVLASGDQVLVEAALDSALDALHMREHHRKATGGRLLELNDQLRFIDREIDRLAQQVVNAQKEIVSKVHDVGSAALLNSQIRSKEMKIATFKESRARKAQAVEALKAALVSQATPNEV